MKMDLFAEKLAAEILAPVPHRHWTFPIPRVLRGLFERERTLIYKHFYSEGQEEI